MDVVVVRQKYVKPPRGENERVKQEMKFHRKRSFLTLMGKFLMPKVSYKKVKRWSCLPSSNVYSKAQWMLNVMELSRRFLLPLA